MRIPLDIDTYKASFLGGNARAYLFYVQINFPSVSNALQAGLGGAMENGLSPMSLVSGIGSTVSTGIDIKGLSKGTEKFGYYVKSTSLPASNLERVSTYWQGQEYKMSGVQRFEDWTVSFNVDNDASVLKKFRDWQNIIHNSDSNIYGLPISYMVDQEVHLLGMETGETICMYKLYGAWPSDIGAVALDYGTNEFATVDITFTYQYHTIDDNTGILGGMIKRFGRGILNNIDIGGLTSDGMDKIGSFTGNKLINIDITDVF